MFGFDRTTSDPNILGGKACIRGMCISVSQIVNLVVNGMTAKEIVAEYPDFESEDIQQALRYAAWATNEMITFLRERRHEDGCATDRRPNANGQRWHKRKSEAAAAASLPPAKRTGWKSTDSRLCNRLEFDAEASRKYWLNLTFGQARPSSA